MPADKLEFGLYDSEIQHPNQYVLASFKAALAQIEATKLQTEAIKDNTKALDNIARLLSVKFVADLKVNPSKSFMENTMKSLKT